MSGEDSTGASPGPERWGVGVDGDVRTTPIVAARTVAFGSDDGTLYAVAERWLPARLSRE